MWGKINVVNQTLQKQCARFCTQSQVNFWKQNQSLQKQNHKKALEKEFGRFRIETKQNLSAKEERSSIENNEKAKEIISQIHKMGRKKKIERAMSLFYKCKQQSNNFCFEKWKKPTLN